MAIRFLWTTTVLFSVLFVRSQCQSITSLNKNVEGHSQKMVEIIELMLSQRPEDTEKTSFGIQKVPQDDARNYEILIMPNKNLQDQKGSQKIKIYVEAANYNGEKGPYPEAKVRSEDMGSREKQNIFDVLPLSIESHIGNNEYQQPRSSVTKYNNEEYSPKELGSYPSKRQTNWSSTQKIKPTSQSESQILNHSQEIGEKVVQREPSYVDQSNPYHPVTASKKDDRQRIYGSNFSSVVPNGKRITPQYIDDYSEQEKSQNRPKDYPKGYENDYAGESIYEIRPTNDRGRLEERESDIRISNEKKLNRDTIVRQNNDRRSSYGTEYRPSVNRNTNDDREPEIRRPNYEIEGLRTPIPTFNTEPEIRPTNERYPDTEKGKPSGIRIPVQKPNSMSRPYEESEYDGTVDSNRPNRGNSSTYSGFPESYQPDLSHHYSRPLQYEPARAFPASPCLNVFKYEGREPEEDRWFADIYVTTDEVLNGMRLDITLDRPAELLTNWLADVKTKDSLHFTLLSLTHKLVPGPAETVRIMVKFNGKKPVPYLKSINLNGRLICPMNRAQKTTTKRPVYENPGDLHLPKPTEPYPEVSRRPGGFAEDYETTTKRVHVERRTTPPYNEGIRTSTKPLIQYHQPNPNGYEDTDLNSFSSVTRKPGGRPPHSNGKPPPHAAKPAHGQGAGHGHGHGQGHGPGFSKGHGNNKKEVNPPIIGGGPPTGGGNLELSLGGMQPIQPSNQPIQGTEIICGTPSVQPSPLITHGQLTSRGQWPWHVALYKNIGTDLTFFCGGSLLNSEYVLTAAHCVTKTYTTKPLDENTLVVYLGKYHLKLWSEGGVQNRQVSKIYVHPNYNSTDFRSDIAVLALSSPVEYTDYVRPICMWDRSNTRIEEVEGKLGTVVGWGFDEFKMLTEELKQAKMPVVEQKTCLWSYPDFYPQFTSNMTYCAGFKNGTSVCNGDSGGGMVFPYKDRRGVERWYLRGIVSISPARNDSRVCDTSHYVVFTDVAKFLPWLDNFL